MNNTNELIGLTTKDANQRLLKEGYNLVEVEQPPQFLLFLQKFWSPVPWMLEITLILELILHKYNEAIIILVLLVFNALLSFFQEARANKALLLLQKHLDIQVRVLRDQHWQLISARDLVQGDIVYLRMGDIAPADIRLVTGSVMIDQSSLTGEAMPIEGEAGKVVYSGSIIKRGEASGEVIATGKNTYFGKTVSLLQIAEPTSHIKDIIFSIVKYLITFIALLIIIIFIYAFAVKLPVADILPFILVLFIAAIPVALPATFTLATALGAVELVKRGVLITRLSAIEEASVLDVICIDKTGTITQNKLDVNSLYAVSPYLENELIFYAALASDEATQDPIDKALFSAAYARGLVVSDIQRLDFIPFDPATKCSEAHCKTKEGNFHVIKGAFDIIKQHVTVAPKLIPVLEDMGRQAHRVLAVAISENDNAFSLVGLIGLQDLPRKDSKAVIAKLKDFGLRILMLTGDNTLTAKAIAIKVGINDNQSDIRANLFPEDKFYLVKDLQKAGHVVGMTGDGVNDAPSLKQAEVGIAVANATDVAKAAACVVLTQPGLSGILLLVETSRRIYQRMHTYILNKISKSIEIAVFLTLGVILTGELLLTPLLMVLLMFTNDFVTMSIATDNASFSQKPERWKINKLMLAGSIIGFFMLILSLGVLYYVKWHLNLTLPEIQTLIFILLVFTAQSNVYIARERHYFWHTRPSTWLLFSSCADILVVSLMAIFGILMAPISPLLIGGLLLVVIVYLVLVDYLKVHIFRYFSI